MFRIGSLKLENWLVMAPMAGITNLPFRLIVKKFGASLVTTEMVSAIGIASHQKKTLTYLKSHPDEKPLSVQIFGSEPTSMAKATETIVESGADIVDINAGCPAPKVTKTGAGGALLRNPRQLRQIISFVRRVCTVPLTVKIRAGWSPSSQSNALEIAQLAADSGADAIIIHPRFVSEGFSGKADWSIIAKLKNHIKIPVIGNGDITSPGFALKMKKQTGCDGVMIGRGALGSPWIFKQILDMESGKKVYQPQLAERKMLILKHFRLLCMSVGENRAARMMRGLLIWYTKALPNCKRFREKITSIKDLKTLLSAMDHYFLTLEME